MKEYCLYIRNGNGKPYTIETSLSIEKVKTTLYSITQLEEERQRPYFVDNDFFDNKYSLSFKQKYLCIKERDVTDWVNYSEEKTNSNNKSNILYFSDYKRRCTK